MPQEIVLDSHAKINLALKIVGSYPDGYHRLETIFQRVSLKDVITLREKQEGIKVESGSNDLPLDSSNLAYMAAEAIINKTGIGKGVSIHIEKRIPIGAGLGGGSSNAAAVLKGLNEMWGLGLGREPLLALARGLGADVPFFLFHNLAFGYERGDHLESIDSECRMWVVLIYSGFPVSTAWVYGNFKKELTKTDNSIRILRLYLQKNQLEQIPKNLVNDLETVVFPVYPEIENARFFLMENGARGALMSGSGSTVFGLFTDRDSAARAFDKSVARYGTAFLCEFER